MVLPGKPCTSLNWQTVRASWLKLKEYEGLLDHANKTLNRLGIEKPIYTREYFASEWEQQKKCKLEAISSLTLKQLEEKLV